MKGKIMMMALLCALLVGLVPPSSAHAEEVDDNYEGVVAYIKELGKIGYTFPSDKHYVVYEDVSGAIWFIGVAESLPYYRLWNGEDKLSLQYGHNLTGYSLNDGVWTSSNSLDCYSHKSEHKIGFARILASSCDIVDYDTGTVFFDCNPGYSFGSWCTDAGLNYAPSSNDLGLIKYGYEGYMHIVRRTGLDKYGRWVLTTIGNSVYADNTEDFTVMVDENGQLGVYCLYSGEEEGGYQLFVRNYVYDTDGWRLMSYELFDVREDDDCIIELGEDSSINDYSLLAYSNVDIYSSSLNLTYPASTEFVDVNDVLPDVPEQPEEPSVTPTVAPLPTVVPPISAGQATVTKNRTAIYEEPSSTSQVQHYLFEGGVVYVVEEYGEDWFYVRYDMGGISYTGYVAQDNVDYDLENGFASEDVIDGYEGQVDDLLGMVGNVPKMIMVLFSFLPPWCLALVGVSFTAMLALIGWKVLRG